MPNDLAALESRLRARALAYPEAWEDFPWGERVVKVRKKIFLFLYRTDEALTAGTKLPVSHEFARMFDACTPTGYGLGKSGWITTRLTPATDFDPGLLEDWLDESYRTIAPRTLVKSLP
ncbi:MmcQ/YjbR family DNA-binding protein [Sandaracinobacteroides hominis]|uniref:MmcQ/YjbR family DNA-binding protein n=1 Tax=Sandaracinobacteroides hominis TaxID=2780086 RepID=UPI0018F51909|nr:MmcQ/YjbR family DNA-binding protein [Sandaracinobacteroides hominis]